MAVESYEFSLNQKEATMALKELNHRYGASDVSPLLYGRLAVDSCRNIPRIQTHIDRIPAVPIVWSWQSRLYDQTGNDRRSQERRAGLAQAVGGADWVGTTMVSTIGWILKGHEGQSSVTARSNLL